MEVKDVETVFLPEVDPCLSEDPERLDGLPESDARGLVPACMPQGGEMISGSSGEAWEVPSGGTTIHERGSGSAICATSPTVSER